MKENFYIAFSLLAGLGMLLFLFGIGRISGYEALMGGFGIALVKEITQIRLLIEGEL